MRYNATDLKKLHWIKYLNRIYKPRQLIVEYYLHWTTKFETS